MNQRIAVRNRITGVERACCGTRLIAVLQSDQTGVTISLTEAINMPLSTVSSR